MRFNVGEKIVPKLGDVRKIRKFLLFPRRIGDQIVWLETVIANQEYRVTSFFDGVGEMECIGWETVSYELIEREHMEYL